MSTNMTSLPAGQASDRRKQRVMKNMAGLLTPTAPGTQSSSKTGTFIRRWATVIGIAGSTVNINLGGTVVQGVPFVSSYIPTLADLVVVDFVGTDPLVTGTPADQVGSPQIVLDNVAIGSPPPPTVPIVIHAGSFVVMSVASNWAWDIPFTLSYGYSCVVCSGDAASVASVDVAEGASTIGVLAGQAWVPGSAVGVDGLIRVNYHLTGA